MKDPNFSYVTNGETVVELNTYDDDLTYDTSYDDEEDTEAYEH